jgi:hypothetical protein
MVGEAQQKAAQFEENQELKVGCGISVMPTEHELYAVHRRRR